MGKQIVSGLIFLVDLVVFCPVLNTDELQSIPKCAFSVCQMITRRGGWNEIRGRQPEELCPSCFFLGGSNLLPRTTKGVGYQCRRCGKGHCRSNSLSGLSNLCQICQKSDNRMGGWDLVSRWLKLNHYSFYPFRKNIACIISTTTTCSDVRETQTALFKTFIEFWPVVGEMNVNLIFGCKCATGAPQYPSHSWLSISREVFWKQSNAQQLGRTIQSNPSFAFKETFVQVSVS